MCQTVLDVMEGGTIYHDTFIDLCQLGGVHVVKCRAFRMHGNNDDDFSQFILLGPKPTHGKVPN